MSDTNEPTVEQAAKLTEQSYEDARKLIGIWLRRDVHWPANYEPVSQHDIRRWAMYSCGDDNPLWCEPEYGRGTVWGSTIASPTFLYTIDTTIVGPGLPGVQWIHGGNTWEFFRPIRPGDTITARARLIDVQKKQGRHVPFFLVQVGEVVFRNQRDEDVARTVRNTLRIPRARTGQGLRDLKGGADRRPTYSREQIEEIDRGYREEKRRGKTPRYWEDVEIGEALDPIVKGPLTLVDIIGFYAGRRNVYNVLKMAFAERRNHPGNVYVSPRTGIPMHPAAGHFDLEIAKEVGMPDVYDQGWMRVNWLAHLITNWQGDAGWLRKLTGQNHAPNLYGDVTWCRGEVTGKSVVDGEHLVELSVYGENQRGEKTTSGTAVVRLPSRDPSSPPI